MQKSKSIELVWRNARERMLYEMVCDLIGEREAKVTQRDALVIDGHTISGQLNTSGLRVIEEIKNSLPSSMREKIKIEKRLQLLSSVFPKAAKAYRATKIQFERVHKSDVRRNAARKNAIWSITVTTEFLQHEKAQHDLVVKNIQLALQQRGGRSVEIPSQESCRETVCELATANDPVLRKATLYISQKVRYFVRLAQVRTER
jgi:hypothetical protein